LAVYYGNSEYSSSNDAFNGLSSEPFVEAPNTKANAIYVGSMLLRNDADFTNSATYQFLPGGLFRNLATAAGTSAAGAGAVVTLSSLADVSLLNNQTNDVLTYNSTEWKNKPITSFGFGTTSSFNTLTASFNSFSSSVNSKTGSWATTGSNTFIGNETISGSIQVSGSISIGSNVTTNISLLSIVTPANYIIHSFPTASYSGAKYFLNAKEDSSGKSTTYEILVAQGNNKVELIQTYTIASEGSSPNPVFSAVISAGNVNFRVTDNGTFTYKGLVTLI
jgi:hypothetical protein